MSSLRVYSAAILFILLLSACAFRREESAIALTMPPEANQQDTGADDAVSAPVTATIKPPPITPSPTLSDLGIFSVATATLPPVPPSATLNRPPVIPTATRPADAPTIAAPADICIVRAKGNDANIRFGPGLDYEIVGRLYIGDYLQVYDQADNGWYHVDPPGTGDGWISQDVVILSGPCSALHVVHALAGAPVTTCTVTPKTTDVVIYDGADSSYPIVGTLRLGTSLWVDGYTAGYTWYHVVFTGQGAGWVYGDQVNLNSGCDFTPVETAIPPTATPNIPPGTAWCGATAQPGLAVNLRLGPGYTFGAVNTFTDSNTLDVLAVTDNGWYQLRFNVTGNIFEGFSSASEIRLSSARQGCETLPVVFAANYSATAVHQGLPDGVSPSDVVIPPDFCTIIAVGESVKIYDGPSFDRPVIAYLDPGPWMPVNARSKTWPNWYRVTLLNGGLGWIESSTAQMNGSLCATLELIE